MPCLLRLSLCDVGTYICCRYSTEHIEFHGMLMNIRFLYFGDDFLIEAMSTSVKRGDLSVHMMGFHTKTLCTFFLNLNCPRCIQFFLVMV